MPTLDVSTGRLNYREQGEGAPLILLHANPGDSRDYNEIIPNLSMHYRVLALDWPGFGGSELIEPESIDVTLYYNVLQEFIEKLGLTNVILMGNSLGGYTATRLAIERPELVKALVLVSPGGFTPHNLMTRAFCEVQGTRASVPPYRFAQLGRLFLNETSETSDAMLERARSEQSTPQRLRIYRSVWRSFGSKDADLRDKADQVQCPTLLVFGKKDPGIPVNKDGKIAKARIKHADFEPMPCGHAPFAEIPYHFLAVTNRFLRNVV